MSRLLKTNRVRHSVVTSYPFISSSIMSLKRNYRSLGRTGLLVSELCLGTMTFASDMMGMPVSGEEEAHKILDRFESVGGNFIDTADVYGDSEEVVGRWLSSRQRCDWVIASKVGLGDAPNRSGLGTKHIKAAIDTSLKRLQTSYIDLYQAHTMDNKTPLEETLRAFDELKRAGKIHYIGLSNFTGAGLQKAIDVCKYLGLAPVASLQPQYSLLCRSTEWELAPVCMQEGVAMLPWSPLAGGWLSGRYTREYFNQEDADMTRVSYSDMVGWKATSQDHNNDHTWNLLDTINKISKETQHSPSQVSLRWLLHQPHVTCPIIGARTLAQFEDNVGAVGWELSPDHMKQLTLASDIPKPYPWGEMWN
eukprot:TRINITY_DN3714_c0_g2_i2.p1 TRINITY_DN3714_c0_g2~~TRINITY_DN3714_c0_g2_i2.p1  ORF type:complete len:364 (+),score=52.02 TRINITY_DN3714_c0_g2_i2:16-1107(+)